MTFAKYAAKTLEHDFRESLIERTLKEMLARFHPEKIILFGSAARGDMTSVSDLDFVVVVHSVDDIKGVNKLYSSLSSVVNWPLDILVVDAKTFAKKSQIGGVYFIARSEGKTLYCAESKGIS